MVLDILVKLAEKTPLRYAVICCASSLSLGNMIQVPQECSQMFVVLVDHLFAAKKYLDQLLIMLNISLMSF